MAGSCDSPSPGWADGASSSARFNKPSGVAFTPDSQAPAPRDPPRVPAPLDLTFRRGESPRSARWEDQGRVSLPVLFSLLLRTSVTAWVGRRAARAHLPVHAPQVALVSDSHAGSSRIRSFAVCDNDACPFGKYRSACNVKMKGLCVDCAKCAARPRAPLIT